MENWLESVYSDGTAAFVSNPAPKMFETVTVRLRMYQDAPVERVFLCTMPNGEEHLIPMLEVKRERGLKYFQAPLQMTQTRMQYQFYLVTKETIYFYNQREITPYVPDHTYDFVLLTDYVQPEWVKSAVFYQIFPERFCNGDPANDVKTGEYSQDGWNTIRMESWDEPVLDYRQGHCLDFYGGDLQGIRKKIPYLKQLGVTALYLNPIFYAPSVHKYDCLDYFHVDPHFGGDQALAELSSALHENGMKLILDISINHTGTDHRWFNRDGKYFDPAEGAYNHPDSVERGYYFFGENNSYKGWHDLPHMPTLNYTSQSLRDVIYRAEDSVLKKWLKPPYSIDGWRFDVADVFARNNEIQLAHDVWPEIRKSIREVNPQAYILAEDWGDCAQYLQGDEWDSPMNYYGCGRVIRQFLGEPDMVIRRYPELAQVPCRLSGEHVKDRVLEHLAKLPYAIWENQFNLFDSHDASRLHNNPRVNREEYRGAVMFQFLLPGAPSIYYGDEAEIDGGLDSMEACRYPMPWGKDIQGGERFRLYSALCHYKQSHRVLSSGGMKFLCAEGNTVAIARFLDAEAVVGVIHVGGEDETIRLPLAAIGADGLKAELFGNLPEYTVQSDGSILLTVKAHQSYFLECSMK